VVDVADRADVHVGLRALELLLAHLPWSPEVFPSWLVAGGGIEPPTQRL
jgi:hypothetical protein